MFGANEAVLLPVEFRFDAPEVYVTRDKEMGDVVLSTRPGPPGMDEFFLR
jgi:antitoxin VapB